jgi:hypothetical protein
VDAPRDLRTTEIPWRSRITPITSFCRARRFCRSRPADTLGRDHFRFLYFSHDSLACVRID